MTLIIALNASLSFGVIVMVVSPLVWAILTRHGDDPQYQPVAVAYGRPLSPRGPSLLARRGSRSGRPCRPAASPLLELGALRVRVRCNSEAASLAASSASAEVETMGPLPVSRVHGQVRRQRCEGRLPVASQRLSRRSSRSRAYQRCRRHSEVS